MGSISPYPVSSHFNSDRIIELERQILRALCSRPSALRSTQRLRLARDLAGYKWLCPEHSVVFAVIQLVQRRGSNMWRDQLPAQATRMGFPDVDWTVFFGSPSVPSKDLRQMTRTLKAEAAKRNEFAN